MKYGIENYIAPAPISLILSIFLFFGVYYVGYFFLKIIKINHFFKEICDDFYFYPIFGCLFLLILLSPITLLGFANINVLKFISILIISLAILNIHKINFLSFYDKNFLIPFLFLLLYFLISLSPTTSADSLDYHSNVAIYILNNGSLPTEHYWFHSRQSGYGEILIALGLSVGAEQFGSLIQFSGILIIFGILKKNCEADQNVKKNFTLPLIIFLSSPILVFLLTSNKPQIMGSGLIALCFVMTFFKFAQLEKVNKALIYFAIINILLIFSVYIKYSFSLSAFIIWFFLIIEVIKSKYNKLKFFYIQIAVFLLFFSPFVVWKVFFFKTNFLEASFLALPINLYGYEALWQSVSSCGYDCGFPTWLFFPKNLSQLTQTLGLSSVVIIIVLFSRLVNFKIKSVIIFYFCIFLAFGQHNARFFLEPLIWSIIVFSFKIKLEKFKILTFLFIFFQSSVVLVMLSYGILTLAYGSLNDDWRKNVLRKTAYNYQYVEWINKYIPEGSILLTIDSKTAYINQKNISLFFLNYIDPTNIKSFYYYNLIKNEQPSHIVFMLPNEQDRYLLFKNCLGKLIKKQKKVGSLTGRNPFKLNNRIFYDAYLYEFKNENFPKCLKKNFN